MRVPRFLPQLFAAVTAMFTSGPARSQIARIDAAAQADRDETIVQGQGRCRWGVCAIWRKFYQRRKDRIARQSRNLNRANGRRPRNQGSRPQMNFARRGSRFLQVRKLRRSLA